MQHKRTSFLSKPKNHWWHTLSQEFRAYSMLALFLFLFLCSLSFYRNLILGEDSIGHIAYWYILVESLILSKIIVIGRFFRLGERFLEKSIIIHTAYKTIVFCLFVVFFSFLEHFVEGFISGKGLPELYEAVTRKYLVGILGRVPLFITVSFPLFALMEVGRVIGRNRLYNLFFNRSSFEKD